MYFKKSTFINKARCTNEKGLKCLYWREKVMVALFIILTEYCLKPVETFNQIPRFFCPSRAVILKRSLSSGGPLLSGYNRMMKHWRYFRRAVTLAYGVKSAGNVDYREIWICLNSTELNFVWIPGAEKVYTEKPKWSNWFLTNKI